MAENRLYKQSASYKWINQCLCNSSNLLSSILSHGLMLRNVWLWKGSLWRINPPYTMWINQAVWSLVLSLNTNYSVWWQWDSHMCFEYTFLWSINAKPGESFHSSEGDECSHRPRPSSRGQQSTQFRFCRFTLIIRSFSACISNQMYVLCCIFRFARV